MSERKRENTVNFAPGPAALPDEVCLVGSNNYNAVEIFIIVCCNFANTNQVIREAQENAWNYKGLGLGVMGKWNCIHTYIHKIVSIRLYSYIYSVFR